MEYKYNIIRFCENDDKAVNLYCLLHGVDPALNIGDITNPNDDDIPTCDILFSSSPCTSVSNIGLRNGAERDSGTASSLMWHNLHYIEKARPKIVIWENVAAIAKGKNRQNFLDYVETINSMGYQTVWQELNPKDFGTPQNRNRTFTVSIRNDLDINLFSFPKPKGMPIDLFNYLDAHVHEKYIVPEHVMKGYANKKSIFKNRWLLRKPGDCGYCLTAKSGRSVITNNYVFNDFSLYNNPPCALNDIDFMWRNGIPVRSLTPEEYWKLQDIPKTYIDKARGAGTSDNQMYIRAGNGINVKVVGLLFARLFMAYPEVFEDMKYITLFSGIGCPEFALDVLYKQINSRKDIK